MKRRSWMLLAFAVLALAGGAVAIGVVVGDDGTPEGTGTTTDASQADPAPSFDAPSAAAPGAQTAIQEEIIAGLTQESLLEALGNPLVVSPDKYPAGGPGAAAPTPPPGGETTTVEPTDPAPRSGAGAAQRRCVQPSGVPARRGYPYKRDCYRGSYAQFPAKVMGVLNFCLRDRDCYARPEQGEWKVCTATVASTQTIDPGNGSVLVTAGHCVGEFDSKSREWSNWTRTFWLPSPKVEEMAKRTFTPVEFQRWVRANAWFPYYWAGSQVPVAYIPQAWKDGLGYRYDFGALVMKPKGGITIQRRLGGVGMKFTANGVSRKVRSYGYPAGRPFDGTRLFVCRGKALLGDSVFFTPPLPTLGIGCDMTGGSSGGPWLLDDTPFTLVVSVNSYGPSPPRKNENLMFGPNLNGDHWRSFLAARDLRP